MGGFIHPKTGETIPKLAPHQVQCWEDRKKSNYRLYLKSQKIGLSTYFLLESIHIALTRGRGKEILIISQSKDKAQEHIQDMKKLILASEYKDFLIEKGKKDKDLLSDEQSKVEVIYLRNPGGRDQTKIIALGITSGQAL